MTSQYRIGIDIGGTFADFSLMDESDGTVRIAKVPSTPDNPEESVIDGIRQLQAQYGIDPADIGYFVHGTTIGVNTVIQRNGARPACSSPRDFATSSILAARVFPISTTCSPKSRLPWCAGGTFARSTSGPCRTARCCGHCPQTKCGRPRVLWSTTGSRPSPSASFMPIVTTPTRRRRGASSRTPAPALSFRCRRKSGRQIREYERTLISVINAFVGKKMSRYFNSLEEKVAKTGVRSTILSTKSNGGIMTASSARERPVETLCSGPASGVIGAHFVARAAGFERVIGLDMGGTSTEVAVIEKDVRYSTENKSANSRS